MKQESFFDLLKIGDMEKVKEELIKRGKSPKPTCPIFFFKDDEEKDKEGDINDS